MSKAVRSSDKIARKDTINDEIDQKDRAFVLFYATWCPFSQRFLPIFKEYAKGNPKECMSVAVDDRPDVCEEYSIEYYPTVILFKKGKVYGRLDAEPGVGLDKKQFKAFTEKS
jgi:thiol-disulfide isomerase/thioredoxin